MDILFVAPRFPLPADTGAKIRTFNILKQLSRDCAIDLVCFSFEESDESLVGEIEKLGINVHLVKGKESGSIDKIGKVLFNPLPFSVTKYHSIEMAERIMKLNDEKRYDAVHFDHIHMIQYHEVVNNVPCFVDEHNLEYKILERCADIETSFWKKRIYKSQSQKMKGFETDKVKRMKHCFAVSKDDQDMLLKITGGKARVDVIANGVDTEFFHTVNGEENALKAEREDAVVFTGSMDWLPNSDAIDYMYKEVMPHIWEQNKNIRLYVVGKNPPQHIKDIGKREPRVIVTGTVDDVRPFIEKAKVFVVPMRIGAGTRLKILEALSMNKAVVSTAVGAEGIQYSDGQNIEIADDPKEFAEITVKLLKDDKRRAEMGVSGRELVCQFYDWNVVGNKLNTIYKEATSER